MRLTAAAATVVVTAIVLSACGRSSPSANAPATTRPAGALSSPEASSSLPAGPGTPSPAAKQSPVTSASPTSPPQATPSLSAILALGHLPSANKPPFTDPQFVSCSASAGPSDPVAIVVMQGASNFVLRDYANEDHPQNLCTFATGAVIDEILDPHHLVALKDGNPSVIEIPSGMIYELSAPASQYAVAPDLSQILWFSLDATSLHNTWDGRDVVLQNYPTTGGRCGAPDVDSKFIAFTRDSHYAYALWAQNFANTTYLNVVSNHQNAFSLAPPTGGWPSPPGGPLMAVWSPGTDALYFTKLGDVWRWSAASGAVDLKPGLHWIDPTISPDGKHIAYVVRDASGTPTVHLMDPLTGAVGAQLGSGARDQPFFLTNDLIWLHGDVSGCIGSQPTTSIYDLRTNTEYPAVLDAVSTTWPAASALGG